MIILHKTHKPLHTMTDTEVDRRIVVLETASDNPRCTPRIRNNIENMIDVYNGERLRRIESFLRS